MDRKFRVNDPVWAKMRGYPPWPAKVTKHPKGVQGPSNRLYVFFYGTHQNAWMLPSDLFSYAEYKDTYLKPCSKKGYAEAVWEIEEDPQLTITSSVKTPKRKGPDKKIAESRKSSSPLPLQKPRKRKTRASPKPPTPHTLTPTPSAMKKELLDSEPEQDMVLSPEAPLPSEQPSAKQATLNPSSQSSEDGSHHRYSTRRRNVTAGIVEDLKQNYMARKEQHTFTTTKATPPSVRGTSPPVTPVVETTPKGKTPTPPPPPPKKQKLTRKDKRTLTTKATPPAVRGISPPVTPKGKTPTAPPKKKTSLPPSKQDKATKQSAKKTTKPLRPSDTRVTRRSQRYISSSNDNTRVIKSEPSQECEQSSQEISSQDTIMDCNEQTDISTHPVTEPSHTMRDCNEQTGISKPPVSQEIELQKQTGINKHPVTEPSQEIKSQEQTGINKHPVTEPSQEIKSQEQTGINKHPVTEPSQEIKSQEQTGISKRPVTEPSQEIEPQDTTVRKPPVVKPSTATDVTKSFDTMMDCSKQADVRTPPVIKPTTATDSSESVGGISSRTRRSRRPQQTNTRKNSRKNDIITEMKSMTEDTDKDVVAHTVACHEAPTDLPQVSTEVKFDEAAEKSNKLSDNLGNAGTNVNTGPTEHTSLASMFTTGEDLGTVIDNNKDNLLNKATETSTSESQVKDDHTTVTDSTSKPSIETAVVDIATSELPVKDNELLPLKNVPDLPVPSSDISHVKDDCEEVKGQSDKEAGKHDKMSPKSQRPKRRIKNATTSEESPLKKFKVSGPAKNLSDKGSSNEKAKDDQRSKLRVRHPSASGTGSSQEKAQTDSTGDVSVDIDDDKKANANEDRESDDGDKEREEDSVTVSTVPSLPPFIAPQSGMSSMQILQTYNYNLKASLTIEAPNAEYAIEMLKKLSNFYCTAADLDKFPAIVDTVKKLKRYRACPGVVEGAERVHEKFKKLFLHPPPPRPAQRIKSASRIPKKAPIMADYIRRQSSLANSSRSTHGMTDVITKQRPNPRQLRTLNTPTVPDKPVQPQDDKESENTVEVPSTTDETQAEAATNIYNSQAISTQSLPSNDKNDQTVPILED